MPKISIIIPIHNHLTAFKKCLPSLVNQTFKDYEIILVNDGSTDALSFWLEEFLRHHQNFPLKIFNQPRQGPAIARNFGFQKSSGQYILFCDADLILKPTMLEKMFYILENHPQASYVYSSFKFGWKTFHAFTFDPIALKKNNYIGIGTLIRRSAFPGFDEKLHRFQDWDLWLTMLEQGNIGVLAPEKILYRAQIAYRENLSFWVPKFCYRLPHLIRPFKKSIDLSLTAKKIVQEKHHI